MMTGRREVCVFTYLPLFDLNQTGRSFIGYSTEMKWLAELMVDWATRRIDEENDYRRVFSFNRSEPMAIARIDELLIHPK